MLQGLNQLLLLLLLLELELELELDQLVFNFTRRST